MYVVVPVGETHFTADAAAFRCCRRGVHHIEPVFLNKKDRLMRGMSLATRGPTCCSFVCVVVFLAPACELV